MKRYTQLRRSVTSWEFQNHPFIHILSKGQKQTTIMPCPSCTDPSEQLSIYWKMRYEQKVFTSDELKGQEFDRSEFINCKFVKTDLRFTSFNRCNFLVCDLSSV